MPVVNDHEKSLEIVREDERRNKSQSLTGLL